MLIFVLWWQLFCIDEPHRDVMVIGLASSVVDHEFEPVRSNQTIKLVFVASPQSIQH
jgi:hypothetical protein